MNSLKSTVIPQMVRAKLRAERLAELGRISPIDKFLFIRRADQMIQFVTEMEEKEVLYGEASSDSTGE